MEIFLILIIGFVLILLISSMRGEIKKELNIINKRLSLIQREIKDAKAAGKKLEVEKDFSSETVKPKEVVPAKPVQPKIVQKPISPIIHKTTEAKVLQPTEAKAENTIPIAVKKTVSKPVELAPKPKKDYEKLIGENWLNKIGIAILVIGIGFFVKYAIDQNWIGSWGRVGIGILTGGILVGIAHFLRKKYHAFSSVLIGGGISVFYYTIAIAYHDYHLFTQPVAFVIMVAITLFSTLMAVLYDRKELAIIALIGAFTSPFMVQSGSNNYVAFFTYIAIINGGMLLLSYFKKWTILTKLALGFTILFFGGWMITTDLFNSHANKYGMLFINLFFVQFLGMNIVYNLTKRVAFNAWEFIQLSSISLLYYVAMMPLLYYADLESIQGVFTLGLAIFFFGLGALILIKKSGNKALSYLLIGKGITFLTLSAALLFDGNYMTIFWAVEAAVLMAVGIKASMPILKNTSMIITAIAVIGLIKDWVLVYFNQYDTTPIFNADFISWMMVTGSFIVTYFITKKDTNTTGKLAINLPYYRMILGAIILITGYFSCLIELSHQLSVLHFAYGKALIIWIYHVVIVLAGLLIAQAKNKALLKQLFFMAGLVVTVAYLVFAQYGNIQIRNEVLLGGGKIGFYYLHFVLTIGIILILIALKKVSSTVLINELAEKWLAAIITVVGLIIATVELDQILVVAFAGSFSIETVLRHTQTEGYTVLWGIYSFLIMIRGMKKQNKLLRILALSIFSVTLLKLFIFDIQNISDAGKILAFISLGVLLLVVSFLYQKLKKIIIDGKVN